MRHSAFGIETERGIMNYIFIASSYSWIFDLAVLYANLFISNPCIIPLNLVLLMN